MRIGKSDTRMNYILGSTIHFVIFEHILMAIVALFMLGLSLLQLTSHLFWLVSSFESLWHSSWF